MRNRQPTHEERLLALEMAKLTTRPDAELKAMLDNPSGRWLQTRTDAELRRIMAGERPARFKSF